MPESYSSGGARSSSHNRFCDDVQQEPEPEQDQEEEGDDKYDEYYYEYYSHHDGIDL